MKPMKLIVRLLFAGTSLFLLAASAYPQSGNACPPPGTEVLFAKVMNDAFVHDYVSCDIIVKVEFVAAGGTPNYRWGGVQGIYGKAPFRVVPPGEQAGSGPFDIPPHVFLPKDKADVIFSFKKGDLLIIRGAPSIGSIKGVPAVFIATDLIAANSSDEAMKQWIQPKSAAAAVHPASANLDTTNGMPDITDGDSLGVNYKAPSGIWTALKLLMPSGRVSRGFVTKVLSTYRGAEAPVRISERRPVFFVQSIDPRFGRELRILQLEKKGDHRELEVATETALGGKSGTRAQDIRDVVVKKVTDNVSSVTPASDLVDGEYVVTDGLSYYDFGIGR